MKFAWSLHEVCMKFAWNCVMFMWSLCECCVKFVWSLCEVCERFMWGLCEVCVKFSHFLIGPTKRLTVWLYAKSPDRVFLMRRQEIFFLHHHKSLCDTVKNELRVRNKKNQFTPQTNMVQSVKKRLIAVKGKRYFDIKNVKPSQENRVQVLPWKDPNIPLEVTNKIFEYLT
jgi:hypothetical protein